MGAPGDSLPIKGVERNMPTEDGQGEAGQSAQSAEEGRFEHPPAGKTDRD